MIERGRIASPFPRDTGRSRTTRKGVLRAARRLGGCFLIASALSSTGCNPRPDEEPGWRVVVTTDVDVGVWMNAWGPASGDRVWAVGGQPTAGVIAQVQGDEITYEDVPADTPLVTWVHGTDDLQFVIAAGQEGTILRRGENGWTRMDSPVTTDLWGVFVVSPDDAYAVGEAPVVDPSEDPVPTLLHWDGAAWTLLPIPPLDRKVSALYKIFATGPDDVFAVGRLGAILHFDGQAWVQQPSGTSSDLISLWGTGPTEILAVGGRSNGVLSRYDGSAWETIILPGIAGLNGTWMSSEGVSTAVGVLPPILEVTPGTLDVTEIVTPETGMVLHAVVGLDDGQLYAVGGSLQLSPPYVGVILHKPAR